MIFLFIFTTLCASQIQSSLALSTSSSQITCFFDDGSYIEEMIIEECNMARSTITKTKIATFKTDAGVALWSVSVTGTINYNGSTSTCTNSKVSTNNNSTTWRLSGAEALKSGNKASANVVAKQYTSNKTLSRTINKTVTLICSTSGVLS